jgi:hypothetical protein
VVHGDGPLAVSADGGATWTEVPLPRSSRASALAVGGPDRIWVGTEAGEVLRLEPAAGAGWQVASRARPRSGYLSGLAADPARPGVLWAAWSDPRGGGVWRSDDAGASWTDRSGGGLPVMPLNAVAVDPDRPDTVLVAADLGVWRSDDAGASWRPFGRGLPASPVAALEVHRPTRLLRAALLGRGVWEAPLGDPAPASGGAATAGTVRADAAGEGQPAARLHLRGTRADGARGGAFPAGRPDPFGSGEATWWWQSPDVKAEAPPDPARDPAGVGPGVFEDDHGVGATGLPDAGGRVEPGRPARVWVQVHNRGAAAATGVRVRVLAAPAFLGWPGRLAADPDRDPPPGSPWRAAGPPATLEAVEPGRAGVVAFDWAVPDGTAADLCLLALAAAGGDPARSTGALGRGDRGGRSPPRWWGSPDPSGAPGEPGPLDRHLGLLGVTVLHPATGPRVLRLEVWGTTGDPPFALAAEPGAQELVAGLLPGPALAGAARAAGLEPARPPDAWRPELVAVVQQDPGLAERLDLTTAFPAPPTGGTWLGGIGLDAGRPEAMLLLLREPVRPGGGSLLLLDAAGRVVGGHTLRVPAGQAPA